ncbi:hypothetical protein CEXT_772381 [Caerostris extrusa]|uniref:Uncharacterized protein n=1 Tax=Caerostris extrusa TaxID=172846 RepID=A0AAV4NTP7_CAEEX|nr:hypothetical protein CEXT_772381 [Caerostris extrusa]
MPIQCKISRHDIHLHSFVFYNPTTECSVTFLHRDSRKSKTMASSDYLIALGHNGHRDSATKHYSLSQEGEFMINDLT